MLVQAVATFNQVMLCIFILWVHQITLPGHNVTQEFQMEPSDSELFASSAVYRPCSWPKSILFG
jgi:hypothetical protein